LNKRLFEFAVNVLKLLGNLKGGKEFEVIKYQLAKSATSLGANYEESQAASSRADFGNKICILLKELRETNYW
jgi:four helix bundle protein